MRYYICYGNSDDMVWHDPNIIITSEKLAKYIMKNIALKWWIKEHAVFEAFLGLEQYYYNEETNTKYYKFKTTYNFWDRHRIFGIQLIENNNDF
jgi:hypothetical protein